MIKFDLAKLDNDIFNKNINRKEEIYEKFNNSGMIGWTRDVDKKLVSTILELRDEIMTEADCLVVIGIGGSYLGSCALNRLFNGYYKDKFRVIYLGNNLSSGYISETLEYLKDKNFYVNVISKTGTTMEVDINYQLVKELMKSKYSLEEMKKRIIITTNSDTGKLRDEVREYGYRSFVIDDDIGGRYSLIMVGHLLPMAFSLDIEKLINGYRDGLKSLKDMAYTYACSRRSLFDMGKYIENYSVYEEKFNYYLEWLKQLFGETEGKDKKGIFPVSTIGTRDLHSLGQFIQEGNPIIFETFIKILEVTDFKYKSKSLDDINNLVLDSVVLAHSSNNTFCNVITIDKINEENIGKLSAFFMMSAAYSGYLFDVEPFNQPGVDVYKNLVRNKLGEE